MRLVTFLRDCKPDLPRAVWIIQLGTVVNFFGFGLVLPFELIYLHDRRGFSLPTSGLIVSTIMAVSVVSAAPAGALADRIGGKRLLVVGGVISGLGYGSLAFATHPWQAFLGSAVAGVGAGCTQPAAGALITALCTREQRIAAFTVARIAINLGIGAGGVAAGLIVASGSIRSFQVIYLLNAATFFGYLCFLAFVPDARPVHRAEAEHGPRGYRFVLGHRAFLGVLAANFVFVIVGYTLFGYTMPIYARHHAHVSSQAIGGIFAANTIFIILFVIPIARLAHARSRATLLGLMCTAWGLACVIAIGAGTIGGPHVGVAILALSGIVFAVGECLHAVVLQPLVTELAPPALVGRYMALFGITFSVGLAAGPSASASALAVSPDLPWIAGAAAMLALLPVLSPVVRRAQAPREPRVLASETV
jgi:MFS family permease